MCVPINVRFFDPTNTQPISQVIGGQPFVARVYAQSDGQMCQNTKINLTYTVQIINTSLEDTLCSRYLDNTSSHWLAAANIPRLQHQSLWIVPLRPDNALYRVEWDVRNREGNQSKQQ